MNSYLLLYLLTLLSLTAVSAYSYKSRKYIDEMHGMMIGMTLGMVSGLVAATLLVIPTGNFLWGVILGSIAGLAFGIPLGRLGGHLGVMEGVMAGPMGGMMGAMLGQMIRPFDLTIFMPFFTSIILISLIGISYATHCGVSCCIGKPKRKLPNSFACLWMMTAIILLGVSTSLDYSLTSPETKNPETSPQNNELKLPSYLQQLNKEVSQEATMNGNIQEITIRITASEYTPNVILAKKGIPLKITFQADETAGCGREVVIPDFKIKKIVPGGGSQTVELTPEKEGTFAFRCSMDMMRGKIIVK